MNGNPFYVEPMGGYGKDIVKGLTGMGQAWGNRKREEERAAAKEAMIAEGMQVLEGRDPMKMAEFGMRNPEMGRLIQEQVSYASAETKAIVDDVYASSLATNDTEQLAVQFERAAQQVKAMGGNPENLMNEAAELRADPDHLRELQGTTLMINPDLVKGYEAWNKANVQEVPAAMPQLPQSIVKGLDPDSQQAASDIYAASGGGQKGIAEVHKALPMLKAEEGLKALPEALVKAFPNASEAEREEIDAAVSGAKSAQEGMKAATKVRTEQRRLEKAKTFQTRAITLLERIAGAEELDDVLGFFDGGTKADLIRMDQGESDIIADITEVKNILTSENMDIMTGVLSQTDIEIIASMASGALDRTRSEGAFKKDIATMIKRMKSKMAMTTNDKAKLRDDNRGKNTDASALEWARSNPNDPRAAQILSRQGLSR